MTRTGKVRNPNYISYRFKVIINYIYRLHNSNNKKEAGLHNYSYQ